MSKTVPKVFVKVETTEEQQENIAKSRKSLKILQKAATDKENLAGRPPFNQTIIGKNFQKSKSADIDTVIHNDTFKRKKLESKCSSTQTEAHILSPQKKTITVEDLTSTESPGEHYWELLAEKRRVALDETLEENKNLHERIEGLEDELNTSKRMVDEARGLIEVLTEMLEEKEENEKTSLECPNVNQGASTSGGDSNYFDATNSLSNIVNDSDDD